MSFPKCVGVIVNQTVKEGTGCGQIYKNAEGIIQASPSNSTKELKQQLSYIVSLAMMKFTAELL